MVRVAVRRGGRKRPNAKGIVYGKCDYDTVKILLCCRPSPKNRGYHLVVARTRPLVRPTVDNFVEFGAFNRLLSLLLHTVLVHRSAEKPTTHAHNRRTAQLSTCGMYAPRSARLHVDGALLISLSGWVRVFGLYPPLRPCVSRRWSVFLAAIPFASAFSYPTLCALFNQPHVVLFATAMASRYIPHEPPTASPKNPSKTRRCIVLLVYMPSLVSPRLRLGRVSG